jgi:holo-[acyl-carrier protein] synthase
VIIGIGSDLCDVRRIEESLATFGARFEERCFTQAERAHCRARPTTAACYAKRFAAKEACAKALGVGIDQGVAWRDMAVSADAHGRPILTLTGGAAERLAAITPAGQIAVAHVTITDEAPYAQAFVVLETREAGDAS